MPVGPGGESVGTAYVRIIASGDDLDKSIRDQFDDAEDEIEKAGRRASATYVEGFESGMKSAPNKKTMNDSIRDTLVKGDVARAYFVSNGWKSFRRSMEKEFKEVGLLAADNLEKGVLAGKFDLDSLFSFSGKDGAVLVKDLRSNLAAAAQQLNAEQKKINLEMLSEAAAMNRVFNLQQSKAFSDLYAEAIRLNKKFNADTMALRMDRDRDFEQSIAAQAAVLEEAYDLNVEYNKNVKRLQEQRDIDFERSVKDQQRLMASLGDTYDEIVADTERLEKGEKTLFGTRRQLVAALGQYRTEMARAGGATKDWEVDMTNLNRRLRRSNPTIDRTTISIGKFADGVGKAFGRGARNNAINLFGSMARGMVNLLSLGPRLIGFFASIANSAKIAFDETFRVTGSVFRSSLAGVTAVLETGGVAIAGLAVAVGALVLVAGPLVAIMLGLVGAATALASSLGFALVAALGAVAGLILPLVAGIGVAIAAFKGLDDQAKKALKADFKPVTKELQGLAEAASKILFKDMGPQAEQLRDALSGLQPITEAIAGALRSVFDSFVDGIASPGFQYFVDHMTKFIPDAIESIGEIMKNTFGGIGGLLLGLKPITREFLEWLEGVTQEFSEWANSKKGRQEIREFFDRAAESAKAFGGFVEDAWGFVKQLLNDSKDTGDSIWTTIGDQLAKWDQFLKDNPDAVGDFFREAEETATQVGRMIEQIAGLIDLLDSPRSRNIGQTIIGLIGGAMTLLGAAIQGALIQVNAVIDLVPRLEEPFRNFGERVGGFFFNVPQQIASALSGVGGRIFSAFQVGVERVRPVATQIVGVFGGIAGRIVAPLAGVGARIAGQIQPSVPGAQRIAGQIVGFFTALPGRIGGAVSSVHGRIVSAFDRAPGAIAGFVTQIIGHFARVGAGIGAAMAGVYAAITAPFDAAVSAVAALPGQIVSMFSGLGARILAAIGNIVIRPTVQMPGIPGLAAGGLTSGPMVALIGEAGREAVVPLDRPLDQVDPSVRWLSAIAQGITPMASGGVGGGKTIDASGWTIVSPTKDPAAVASEVVNRLVATGY